MFIKVTSSDNSEGEKRPYLINLDNVIRVERGVKSKCAVIFSIDSAGIVTDESFLDIEMMITKAIGPMEVALT